MEWLNFGNILKCVAIVAGIVIVGSFVVACLFAGKISPWRPKP
uniref:Uncharacterized protein n=1 Tax=viral metagenome TaxID=1070528 RepID=A0A6H1ZXK4_9ZZZZ